MKLPVEPEFTLLVGGGGLLELIDLLLPLVVFVLLLVLAG